MSSNRIVKSELFSTITKGGKQIALGVATETQKWNRPKETARAQGPGFKSAVVNDSATLPAGTVELIQRSVSTPLLSYVTKTHRCTVRVSIPAPVTIKNTGLPLLETRIINILRPFMFQNRNRPNNGLVVGYPCLKLQLDGAV
jgi:hypothetical protein